MIKTTVLVVSGALVGALLSITTVLPGALEPVASSSSPEARHIVVGVRDTHHGESVTTSLTVAITAHQRCGRVEERSRARHHTLEVCAEDTPNVYRVDLSRGQLDDGEHVERHFAAWVHAVPGSTTLVAGVESGTELGGLTATLMVR